MLVCTISLANSKIRATEKKACLRFPIRRHADFFCLYLLQSDRSANVGVAVYLIFLSLIAYPPEAATFCLKCDLEVTFLFVIL